jgi:hypothetical protein
MSRQERSPYRLSKLLKSARKDNLHPEVGGKKAAVRVALDTFQADGLKRLANKHGTTVGTELSNAVDAYLLGLTREEVRSLGLFADLTKASALKTNQKLTGTLREIDKSTARIARMERRGVKSRKKKQR